MNRAGSHVYTVYTETEHGSGTIFQLKVYELQTNIKSITISLFFNFIFSIQFDMF